MHYLDDQKNYLEIDRADCYQSFNYFKEAFETSYHEAVFVNLPFEVQSIKHIVAAGMGGSSIPGSIVKSLSPYLPNLSIETVSNYRLPGYIDHQTLTLLISYSGNTKEILSCFHDQSLRQTPCVIISTGGELERLAKQSLLPLVKIDSHNNPSGLPRFGWPSLLGAAFGLLSRFDSNNQHNLFNINQLSGEITKQISLYEKNIPASNNIAKEYAFRHKEQGLIIFSANHLNGVAHMASNFINETAKTFATHFEYPDLTHHLLDGLQLPSELNSTLKYLILNSPNYPKVIQAGMANVRDTLVKQKKQVTQIKTETDNPVAEVIESLVFLSFFGYYLSITNKVDPSATPMVDHFKKLTV